MKTVFCVFGTRPEAIKMIPVILAIKSFPMEFCCRVVVTGQHRHMLDQVLGLFKIKADYDLDIMSAGQTLTDITVKVLKGLESVFTKELPDLVLVHGDTTTAAAAALSAFYKKIPVGHVEAGLRSFDKLNPYPEELNRVIADAICNLHFAPTSSSKENLLNENIRTENIFVTGNTGIDTLKMAIENIERGQFPLPEEKIVSLTKNPFVLVTAHRRENFGNSFANICEAISEISDLYPHNSFIYPVHPNPNVSETVNKILKGKQNIHLLAPLEYNEILYLMNKCLFVLTDSGGLQEEAPSFGKPVLVLRDVTERPEAVEAGTVRIVGTEKANIKKWIQKLFDDENIYRLMANAVNPYGDGNAAKRIVMAIRYFYHFDVNRPEDFSGH